MGFYTFNQNNPGGRFTFNPARKISHYVIVEGDNIQDINYRAEQIGIYFDGVKNKRDCSCCGDRWYEPFSTDELTEKPMVYDKVVEPNSPFVKEPTHFGTKWIKEGPEGFIHYKDGRVEPFWL